MPFLVPVPIKPQTNANEFIPLTFSCSPSPFPCPQRLLDVWRIFLPHTGIGIRGRGGLFQNEETKRGQGRPGEEGQGRRAARFHQSFPCTDLDGYSQEALRPPHPPPKADDRATTSSFLYFERDPHDPSFVSGTPVSSNLVYG
jgi:hypothetical protein